jgi:hypothetical protein
MEGHGALDTEASAVSPADYTAAGMGSGWGRGWGDELWVLDERQRQRQLEDMYEPHQFIGRCVIQPALRNHAMQFVAAGFLCALYLLKTVSLMYWCLVLFCRGMFSEVRQATQKDTGEQVSAVRL